MSNASDAELLEQFARNQSEPAFAELVERYLGLVYSAAFRRTENPQHAQDIAQAVFIILARKAGSLGPKTVLAGWLYHTARLTAANFQRAELRRIRREQEAFMQSSVNEPAPDAPWHEMSPLLEDAMAGLGTSDRDAIVLRFFQNRSMADVGAALGASEDAAKMRVNRALEKLRKFFNKRGVVSTTAIIGGAISSHSVQAAPAGMAKIISTIGVVKGAAASASTLTLVKGALKMMTWNSAKTGIVAGTIALLAAGVAAVSIYTVLAPAPFVEIKGKGQIELYSYYGSRVIETADMTIWTDGKSYRMSIDSSGGTFARTADNMQAQYGSDGLDTFVLSDQVSVLNRTRDGLGGFARPGRFPKSGAPYVPLVVQAAWLAYCSDDYFNVATNHTGLKLGNWFSMIWPDCVTNLVGYWTNSTAPQTITGWSRNVVILPRTNSDQPPMAAELKQYPDGFKAWQFTAADPVTVGNKQWPRRISLETFFPKPPGDITNGDDVTLLRKATFVADSITLGQGTLDPLPPVTAPDVQVDDERFADIAASFVIISHATPQGWPVRGSKAFNTSQAAAEKLAKGNPTFVQSELKKENEQPQVVQ